MSDILNWGLMAAFIPTFFFVSVTPGMCMTLAMTLGMTIGFKRSLWMMSGELLGVGLVASASVIGVSAIVIKFPEVFYILRYGGGAYLTYIGINLWLSKGKTAIKADEEQRQFPKRTTLITQGFITAISNPKGWAFFVALLPPFIDADKSITLQLIVLITIILLFEFICMCIYCIGGNTMRRFLQHTSNVQLLNRISGTLMIGVAIWLVFG